MCKTYCDRCGKEFEYGEKFELMTQSAYEVCLEGPVRRGYSRDRVDICPECQVHLNTLVEDFMKGANI